MKTISLLPSVALMLALTAGAAGQKTQAPTSQPQASPNMIPPGAMNPWAAAQDAPTPYNEWMKSTVSFEFPGGTLKDYVEAVRAAAKDKPVNVMFRDGAEQSPVAATAMREVSIFNALYAPTDFGNMIPGRGMALVLQQVSSGNLPGGMPSTTVPAFVYIGSTRNYVVGQDVSVLSLNEVCTPPWVKDADPSSLPSGDVLKAVETAVEAVGDRANSKPAELAFHRESGLLVVKGTDRQITVAKNVIQSLGQDVRRLRESRAIAEDKRKNDVGEAEVLKIRENEILKVLDERHKEIERERARTNEVRKELDEAMRQVTQLRMKLESMNATTAPSKKEKE